MAATENSQMCLEKRNIQRSNDGPPLRSVHWGMNVLFAKKSQLNSSGADKRFPQKTSERVPETNSHPKSVLKGSKHHHHTSASSTGENRDVGCGLGSVPVDGVAGQSEEEARNGNNALGRFTGSRFERRDSLAGCEGWRTPRGEGRGGGAPGVGSAKETRITSLRKLLNAPLGAPAAAPEQHAEGGDAKESSCREEPPLAASQPASPRSRSTDAQHEAAAMNGEIKRLKSHRKRPAKSVESALNAACHDEVKEKIAELARMPRIKSLDEILETLHIKVEPKAGDEDENANALCLSEKCSTKEECCLSDKRRTEFHDGLAGENQKPQTSAFGLDTKGNVAEQKTPQQSVNRKDDRSSDTKKHVKVLISGEVSRKPKPTYASKIGSENSRECNNISYLGSKVKSGSQGVLATRNTEFEDDCFQRKCDWKTNRKLQSILARKRQVNNTKELKAILQARTSYRKEISSGRNCASGLNSLEVPLKKRRLGHVTCRMSPSEERQWNDGTTYEAESLDKNYSNSDFQKDIGCSSSNEEISPNSVTDGCDAPDSPADSESDQFNSQENIDEVRDILSQLPPLNITDISWTEWQDCEPKVKSPEDIQWLVDRMQKEHLEGVNGNYNRGATTNLFREWHETVVRPSYAEHPLTLLPYVIID